MKLTPLFTEKSVSEAKKGNYTFLVPGNLTKTQIRSVIKSVFGVDVVKVRTITKKSLRNKDFKGRIKVLKGSKKAIISVKEGQKISLFEEEKKKGKSKKK